MLFDSHQIVFAEGICVESSIASQQLAPLLPPGLALDHRASGHDALELDPALARRPDLALALARASRG